MILVLAESSLELIPREIQGHPVVVSDARRRGKSPSQMLLDRSRHHKAMAKLEESWRRGRPDIVHLSLLAAQYSVLNLAGRLKVYVHTLGDLVIDVDPSTRIPKNYYNFVGLMEQLLTLGRVPPRGRALIKVERKSLEDLLRQLPKPIVLLHERGRRASFEELGRLAVNSTVVVGAFPRGDFKSKLFELADEVVSIGNYVLDSWQVVSRVIAAAEVELKLI